MRLHRRVLKDTLLTLTAESWLTRCGCTIIVGLQPSLCKSHASFLSSSALTGQYMNIALTARSITFNFVRLRAFRWAALNGTRRVALLARSRVSQWPGWRTNVRNSPIAIGCDSDLVLSFLGHSKDIVQNAIRLCSII
jgi:hypothetical protein